MARSTARVPSAEEVTAAFSGMTSERLKVLLANYIDNIKASGSPIFDVNCLLSDIPTCLYYARVSIRQPECQIVNYTSALLAWITVPCVAILSAFVLALFVDPDFFILEFVIALPLVLLSIAAGPAAVLHFVNVRRRIGCQIPSKLHDLLLKILIEVREQRRGWLGIKIGVKLAGAALFEPIAGSIVGDVSILDEHLSSVLGKYMDEIADRTVDAYLDKDGERVKDGILSRLPYDGTRQDAAQRLLDQSIRWLNEYISGPVSITQRGPGRLVPLPKKNETTL